jgi:hypothetical protein
MGDVSPSIGEEESHRKNDDHAQGLQAIAQDQDPC